MKFTDITEKVKRIGKKGNPTVKFSEEGCPYMFQVTGIGMSGFEVKVYSAEGHEILTIAGGTGEDTLLDIRKNDHNLSGKLYWNIYHMCKSKFFYERNKHHNSNDHYMTYRNAFLKEYKNK